MVQLQERMRMWDSGFTVSTEVEVFKDRALVANSDNWRNTTAITNDTFVDNGTILDDSFDLPGRSFNLNLIK